MVTKCLTFMVLLSLENRMNAPPCQGNMAIEVNKGFDTIAWCHFYEWYCHYSICFRQITSRKFCYHAFHLQNIGKIAWDEAYRHHQQPLWLWWLFEIIIFACQHTLEICVSTRYFVLNFVNFYHTSYLITIVK